MDSKNGPGGCTVALFCGPSYMRIQGGAKKLDSLYIHTYININIQDVLRHPVCSISIWWVIDYPSDTRQMRPSRGRPASTRDRWPLKKKKHIDQNAICSIFAIAAPSSINNENCVDGHLTSIIIIIMKCIVGARLIGRNYSIEIRTRLKRDRNEIETRSERD